MAGERKAFRSNRTRNPSISTPISFVRPGPQYQFKLEVVDMMTARGLYSIGVKKRFPSYSVNWQSKSGICGSAANRR